MISERFFVDTSFLIVLEIRNDQNHNFAKKLWKTIPKYFESLIITDYIFDECLTFFNGRGLHNHAVKLGSILLQSKSFKMFLISIDIFAESWSYFKKCFDKNYSFTDCTSFSVLKRNKISNVLTFDKHFHQAGFIIIPHKIS